MAVATQRTMRRSAYCNQSQVAAVSTSKCTTWFCDAQVHLWKPQSLPTHVGCSQCTVNDTSSKDVCLCALTNQVEPSLVGMISVLQQSHGAQDKVCNPGHLTNCTNQFLPCSTPTGTASKLLTYNRPLNHTCVALKLHWAHISDLPAHWLAQLQALVARTGRLLTKATARDGCIELTLDLAGLNVNQTASHNTGDRQPDVQPVILSELAQALGAQLETLVQQQLGLGIPDASLVTVWLNNQRMHAKWCAETATWNVVPAPCPSSQLQTPTGTACPASCTNEGLLTERELRNTALRSLSPDSAAPVQLPEPAHIEQVVRTQGSTTAGSPAAAVTSAQHNTHLLANCETVKPEDLNVQLQPEAVAVVHGPRLQIPPGQAQSTSASGSPTTPRKQPLLQLEPLQAAFCTAFVSIESSGGPGQRSEADACDPANPQQQSASSPPSTCHLWPSIVCPTNSGLHDGLAELRCAPVQLLVFCGQQSTGGNVEVSASANGVSLQCEPLTLTADSQSSIHPQVSRSLQCGIPSTCLLATVRNAPVCGQLHVEVRIDGRAQPLQPVLLLPDARAAEELQSLLCDHQEFAQECQGTPLSRSDRLHGQTDLLQDLGGWLQFIASDPDTPSATPTPHVQAVVAVHLFGTFVHWGCIATACFMLQSLFRCGYNFRSIAQAVVMGHGRTLLQLAVASGESAMVHAVLSWGQQHGLYDWASASSNSHVHRARSSSTRAPIPTQLAYSIDDSDDEAAASKLFEHSVPSVQKLATDPTPDMSSAPSTTHTSQSSSNSSSRALVSPFSQVQEPAPPPRLLQCCFLGFADAQMESLYVRFLQHRFFRPSQLAGVSMTLLMTLAAAYHMRYADAFSALLNTLLLLLKASSLLLWLRAPSWAAQRWEACSCALHLMSSLHVMLAAVSGSLFGPLPFTPDYCAVVELAARVTNFLWLQVRLSTSLRTVIPLDCLSTFLLFMSPSWFGRSGRATLWICVRSLVLFLVQLARDFRNRRAFVEDLRQKQK